MIHELSKILFFASLRLCVQFFSMRCRRRALYLSTLFLACFSDGGFCDQPWPMYALPNQKVALEGYDVVSLLEEERLVKGSPDMQVEYEDVQWRFSSRENLEKFIDNPHPFLPQYAGYCAWAMREGRLSAGLVRYSMVAKGKLYLACNEESLKRWKDDLKQNIRLADRHWKNLSLQSEPASTQSSGS